MLNNLITKVFARLSILNVHGVSSTNHKTLWEKSKKGCFSKPLKVMRFCKKGIVIPLLSNRQKSQLQFNNFEKQPFIVEKNKYSIFNKLYFNKHRKSSTFIFQIINDNRPMYAIDEISMYPIDV